MPLYEYLCKECGTVSEVLVLSAKEKPRCRQCGSNKLNKQLTAPSSFSGAHTDHHPGPADHGCCGGSPSEAGCAGPGSCCGKR